MDERALVERLIARDPPAWERFLKEFGPAVVRAAAAVLSRRTSGAARGEAEDVAQKVFALLLESDARLLRSFQGRSSLSTWLIGIARRQALMLLRGERPQAPLPRAAASPSPGPLEDVARAESEGQLEAAFSGLSPRERLILALHYRDRVPYAEIAALLGVSPNSVSPLLDRARERLKAGLLALKRKGR
jgi:RNA polymerase sigma-70 factor (ECF subfamily)